MTVVAFTAHKRVGYMQEVINTWSAVRGIDTAHVLYRVEPVSEEMYELCKNAPLGKTSEAFWNDKVYSALGNPWLALETGFRHDDFVILAEDDSVVSDDVLEYFDYCRKRYEKDKNVLGVCTFWGSNAFGEKAVRLRSGFSPTVWGTWADRWDELKVNWDFDYRYKGWDWHIVETVMGHRKFVFPGSSRSQHIGRLDGTHMLPKDFERLQSPCFQYEYGPGEFYEVEAE